MILRYAGKTASGRFYVYLSIQDKLSEGEHIENKDIRRKGKN